MLYKNNKGNIFGGYASISWTKERGCISAPDCFIFTLTNIFGFEPTKFINSNRENSIFHDSNYGPSFGNYNDIDIKQDYKNSVSYSFFPKDYEDILGKGKSIFTGELDNKKKEFMIEEIEVLKLFK